MYQSKLGFIAFLFATLVAAAPAPAASLEPGMSLLPRAISWTNQPKVSPECTNTDSKSPKSKTYSNEEIEAAIDAAVDAIINDKLKLGPGKSKTPYPHINTPDSAKSSQDKWTDYDLTDCAQGGDSKEKKAGFVEFPIMRDGKVYTGGEAGPDRVLFQFVTDGDKRKTYAAKGFKNLEGNFSMFSHSQ